MSHRRQQLDLDAPRTDDQVAGWPPLTRQREALALFFRRQRQWGLVITHRAFENLDAAGAAATELTIVCQHHIRAQRCGEDGLAVLHFERLSRFGHIYPMDHRPLRAAIS